MSQPQFKTKKAYFKGNEKFGRSTQLLRNGNAVAEYMGACTLKECLKSFNSNRFTPVFTVFKAEATTRGPVTILREEGEPFDIKKKMDFFRWLGYTVNLL